MITIHTLFPQELRLLLTSTIDSYWPSPTNTLLIKTQTQAIALGLGSLFNHSTNQQNVGWRRDIANECIIYTALRDIGVGEECCISYGNGRLWFKDSDAERDEAEGMARADDTSEATNPTYDRCDVPGQRSSSEALQLSGLSDIMLDASQEVSQTNEAGLHG
jgi:hypothetical protein